MTERQTATICQALVERIVTAAARKRDGQLVAGLCGAQGIGKSTLTALLHRALAEGGHNVASISLDDFYLTRADRTGLARSVHPLLQTRGVPGTHDVSLAIQTLSELRASGSASLPSFDKAIDDRRPRGHWVSVETPVDIVLFEGWCVGALAQRACELDQPVNALEREEDQDGTWRHYANRALATTYQVLFEKIDLLVLLAAPSFDHVYQWRLQQERELRKSVATRHGSSSKIMEDHDVVRFIGHYERLTRHILAEMPARADVIVAVDGDRKMIIKSRV